MAQQDSQDRTHPASQRKLEKARKDGNVARSQDFGHFAAVAAGGAALVVMAPQITGWLKDALAGALRFNSQSLSSPQFMLERLAELTLKLLWVVLPLGLLMVAVGVLGSFLIGGWNFSLQAVAPKVSKLNPLAGVGRIFSKHQMVVALKAALLALLLGVIGAFYLRSQLEGFIATLTMPLPAALAHAGDTLLGGLLLLVMLLAVFALVDAPLQRHLHAERLKMSHQEVKQEYKEMEGNAEVKGKLRQLMREASKKRMMAAVPTADLVVMNPTHYAVALKYDDTQMGAPRVVAMGADLLALRIRDLAKESKVPVLQAPALARALYAHAELDKEIPAALFAAVAQVLAYVYQLRAAMAGKGVPPADLPELNVPVELDPHHGKRQPNDAG
ncbi:MAG: flagellar biosynthesis protein FlhB [Burkholderiales bacterium]